MLDCSDAKIRASRLLLGRLWSSEVTSFALLSSAVTLAFTFLEAVAAVEERFLLPTSEAVEALSTDDELASEDMVKGRYVVQCRACSSFS